MAGQKNFKNFLKKLTFFVDFFCLTAYNIVST